LTRPSAVLALASLVGLAVALPGILLGSGFSALDLLALAASVLVGGLAVRWGATGSTRTLGSAVAIVGVVLVVLVLFLIWALLQGAGRPF
jgi:hypothetical protein